DPTTALGNVHVSRFPADESFVRFHFAAQKIESTFGQSEAQTMCHEPCGFLGHSEIAGQFATADSVLAVHHKPQSRKPPVQTERGIFKNGASFQRELRHRMPGVALPYAILGKVGYFL